MTKLNSFFLLLITISFLIYSCNTSDSKTKFNVTDTSKISRIEILGQNELLEFERKSVGWSVNEKYSALPEAVDYLLRLSLNIVIKAPVSKEENDSLFNSIKNNFKKIIFFEDNEIVKTWFLGKFSKQDEGTYALVDENSKVLIISVPGLTNDLDKNIPSHKFLWITAKIFEYEPNDIVMINVEYPMKPDDSFKISFKKNNETDFYCENKHFGEKEKNILAIGAYLSYFKSVKFNSFLQDFSKNQKDSLLKETPFFVIEVKNKNGVINSLKAFYIKNEKNEIDNNSYLGVLNESEFVKVDFFDTDLIMKTPEYFKSN